MNLFETRFDTRLELMNLTSAIFLIDIMVLFSGLLNQGNPDDQNFGSVRDYKISVEMTDILYVLIFAVCISIHLFILLARTFKGFRLICKKAYAERISK